MTVVIFYAVVVYVSAAHAIFVFERAKRSDAGTPDKIMSGGSSAIH